MMKTCVVCGGAFESHVHNQSHCSVACRNRKHVEARRRTGKIMRLRVCAVCGATFEATGHGSGHVKTCSPECRAAMRRSWRKVWEATSPKYDALLARYAQEGRNAEYHRRSRARNLDGARERERAYSRKARAALKLIREIETKGLEALL